MRAVRLVASAFGWLPTAILVAVVLIGGIALTVHAISTVWIRILLAGGQGIGLPALLALAWAQERAELEAYESAGKLSPAEEQSERRAAEAYDATWQVEDRERNRELGRGSGA